MVLTLGVDLLPHPPLEPEVKERDRKMKPITRIVSVVGGKEAIP